MGEQQESHEVLPLGTSRPEYPHDPLPSWVTRLRDHQVTAVREIVQAFEEGADVVFLDAPVGAGKTLIAELARREMRVRKGLYICTDKALQDQFLGDFPAAKVLKGRSNYIPDLAIGDVTCEDCTSTGMDDPCNWCEETSQCPYKVARYQALGRRTEGGWVGGADVAVLNTAYFLTAANHARTTRRYELGIADEADMLESALIGFIEYEVPKWIAKEVGLTFPNKGVHKATIAKWLGECADLVRGWYGRVQGELEVKKRQRVESFVAATANMKKMLEADIANADDEESGRWIRDYGSDRFPVETLKLRPVTVDKQGVRHFWQHAEKWLLMSGTIISADEMADSLGLPLDYRTVSIPSSFPVENRKITLAPIANVTRAATDEDYDNLVYAIEKICAEHEGRVLIHTVSYALTRRLYESCELPGRRKVQYSSAAGKNSALDTYLRSPNAVMFAPSMDRGVDLAGEACRVQIIAKCPFPSLGDRQVSARMRLPGGQYWYAVRTIRDIVQMTGRGVRSEDDWCHTYILDEQFTRNVWGRNKTLFPEYFREAVDARSDVRWLMKKYEDRGLERVVR